MIPDPFWEKLLDQNWVILAIALPGLFAAFVTLAHFRNKPEDRGITQWLRDGTMQRYYRSPLSWLLWQLDRWMCPPEYLMATKPTEADPENWREAWETQEKRGRIKPGQTLYKLPTNPRRAWNWQAYDRMLLLAVAYPLGIPLLIWVFSGEAQFLGALQIIPKAEHWWQGPLLGGALLGLAISIFRSFSLNWTLRHHVKNDDNKWYVLLFKYISPLSLKTSLLALTFLFASTFLIVAAGGYSIGVAFPGSLSGTILLGLWVGPQFFGSMGIMAIFGAFMSAAVSSSLIDFRVAFPFAFAATFAIAQSVKSRRAPRAAYSLLTMLAFGGLAYGVAHRDPGAEADSLLLFLGLLPLVNAVFDYLSLGLTRLTLRHSLVQNRSLPAAVLWWLADLFGAVILMIGLIAALLWSVHGLNQLTPDAPLLDLKQLFRDLSSPEKDMRWLYFTIFSTLLPTALHALLAYFGFWFRIPGNGWLRETLARWSQTPYHFNDKVVGVAIGMGLYLSFIAATLVLPYALLLPHAENGHGIVLDWVITRAELYADNHGMLGELD
ncbi:MAG: hypothetical protein ACPGNV_10210 [Mangrovicoccus sp.]